MSDLKRTHAKPTKPGFYWLLQADQEPQIVEVVIDGERRFAYMAGCAV